MDKSWASHGRSGDFFFEKQLRWRIVDAHQRIESAARVRPTYQEVEPVRHELQQHLQLAGEWARLGGVPEARGTPTGGCEHTTTEVPQYTQVSKTIKPARTASGCAA